MTHKEEIRKELDSINEQIKEVGARLSYLSSKDGLCDNEEVELLDEAMDSLQAARERLSDELHESEESDS